MEGESVFNIVGVPNDEFIEEVTESTPIKKNAIFFALLTDGVAGDPGFGVGLSELVMEQNTSKLRSALDKKVTRTLPALVDGVSYDGMVSDQKVDQQLLLVDLKFTDTDSDEKMTTPLAFSAP